MKSNKVIKRIILSAIGVAILIPVCFFVGNFIFVSCSLSNTKDTKYYNENLIAAVNENHGMNFPVDMNVVFSAAESSFHNDGYKYAVYNVGDKKIDLDWKEEKSTVFENAYDYHLNNVLSKYSEKKDDINSSRISFENTYKWFYKAKKKGNDDYIYDLTDTRAGYNVELLFALDMTNNQFHYIKYKS
jgi:hypothetical protein